MTHMTYTHTNECEEKKKRFFAYHACARHGRQHVTWPAVELKLSNAGVVDGHEVF